MAESKWQKMLGKELQGKDGMVPVDQLELYEVVGIYFSAHWCGPCRRFTPELSQVYQELQLLNKTFQVVFVSGDRDEESFKDYYGSMPWLALPYDKKDLNGKLNRKFGIQGIPSLVLLDRNGNLISKNGRETIMSDRDGFPWPQQSVHELLGDKFLSHDGQKNASAIKGKYLALYFSASWCPPCQRFTPTLAETYKKIKEKRDDVEFIFISGDRSKQDMEGYFKKMPFLALPFERQKENGKLNSMFEVQGIPSLVVLDPAGKTITTEARNAVPSDPNGDDFPWHPKPVNDVDNPSGINENKSLVILADGESKGVQEELQKALFAVAEEERAKEDPEYLFFMGTNPDGVCRALRKMSSVGGPKISTGEPQKKETVCEGDVCKIVKTGGDKPNTKAILFDIPDRGGFYVFSGEEITTASLKEFLKTCEDGKGERLQLKKD